MRIQYNHCRETQEKVDIDFKAYDSVEYRRQKFWYFEPEKSVGSLEDTLVTINFPLVAAANYARGNTFLQFALADVTLNKITNFKLANTCF